MSNSIVKQDAWLPVFIENLHSVNVALNFCDTSPVVTDAGTAKILSTGAIAAGSYTANTDFTLSDAVAAANTLTLNQSPYWAVSVDDFEAVQSNPEVIANLTREGAYAISDAIDAYILGLYASAASGNKITGASSAAIPFTGESAKNPYETIVDLGTALTKSKAPMSGRWLVLSPEIYGMILKDTTRFIRASALGDMVVTTARFGTSAVATPGFVGQIAGFDTYVSNNLTKASSNANVYCLAGQGKPIHFASQLGDVKLAEPAKQFSTIVKQAIAFGAAVLGPNTGRLGLIYAVNS